METYFEKYPEEMNAAEVESPVSEENFMRFYHRKVRGRRIRIAVSTVATVAVAFVAVAIFAPSRPATTDFVAVYIDEYKSALRPLYDEVVSMESQSELCAELGLSSVMKELVESVTEFSGDLNGIDGEMRMEMVRQYCDSQTERISQLYAEDTNLWEMYQ